jgi:hypothetical protein
VVEGPVNCRPALAEPIHGLNLCDPS